MTTLHIALANAAATMIDLPQIRSQAVAPLILWVTGFLCLLNIGLAILFRKNKLWERLSYWFVCIFEFAIFIVALLVMLGVITKLPLTLPGNLPINQAFIAAALAVGIGLFPAAYWHKVNVSELPKRIAEDGKAMKEKQGTVRVRGNGPGEWLNS